MAYLIDNLTENDKAKYRERSVRAINGIDILLSDVDIVLRCKTIRGKYFTIAQYIGLSSDNSVSFYNYFIPTNVEMIFLLRFSNHNNTNPNFYNAHERNGKPNKRWVVPFHGNGFQKESPYDFLQAEQNVIHYPVNALDDEFSVKAFLLALRQLFINGKVDFPQLPQQTNNNKENNQQIKENTTMKKKQVVRLNESQLHRIIKASVKRVLKENNNNPSLSQLKAWADESVEELRNGDDACYYAYLGESDCKTGQMYIVIGWYGGFDEDPNNPNADGEYRICAKLAYNCDDLQCDYEWDWEMPYDEETGDVDDTNSEYDGYTIDYLYNHWKKYYAV